MHSPRKGPRQSSALSQTVDLAHSSMALAHSSMALAESQMSRAVHSLKMGILQCYSSGSVGMYGS